ncbi:hypothetical protein SAMN05443377_1102 [Propionibacterium cyclohexanicum]|uniref:Uncharacterized protein n=1 Tax=Propionibacterium cyclohexanicum TaxID=64702 RepID=A0A1H9RY81_9ACTN|nr:hypothetical protein [Propionibacterium cyclohexanicum]SER77355.1 hypothetical protein SAMN05443377_1102 [Propionibacterium cyclohexanicum]
MTSSGSDDDPDVTRSAGTEGLGVAPQTPIATLPPLPASHRGVPLSPRTGEPIRPGALVAVQCLLYAGAGAAAVGYLSYWWVAMHVEQFFDSAWVVGWLRPRPGGAGSVWLVVALAAAVAAMVAAPCVCAYQAWTGYRSARQLGIVALVVSVLGVLFNPVTCLAIPLTALALGLAWHPALTRYFEQWESLRKPPEPLPAPPAGSVVYGRLPRFE